MKDEVEKRFPNLTENQVYDLAELGKSILKISESKSLALSLLFITKEFLISDPELAAKSRYCISDIVEIAICLIEYKGGED